MGKSKQIEFIDSEPQTTLEDFVIPAKIAAFCDQYRPASQWSENCDVFTDYQLRSYFKAVVCPLGDPLSIYLQELASRGFHMHNDICGEPVIYCIPK